MNAQLTHQFYAMSSNTKKIEKQENEGVYERHSDEQRQIRCRHQAFPTSAQFL